MDMVVGHMDKEWNAFNMFEVEGVYYFTMKENIHDQINK